jgi:hypothetical protein
MSPKFGTNVRLHYTFSSARNLLRALFNQPLVEALIINRFISEIFLNITDTMPGPQN